MARLVVRQAPDGRPDRGRDLGRIHGLNGSTLMIGRAKEAGFSLNSSNVSKRHAELTFKRGSYFIHDLGSTQGTKLNGVPVGKDPANAMRLKSGDQIWLADTVLEFIEESAVPMPPTAVIMRPAPAVAEPPAPVKSVSIPSAPSIAEPPRVFRASD